VEAATMKKKYQNLGDCYALSRSYDGENGLSGFGQSYTLSRMPEVKVDNNFEFASFNIDDLNLPKVPTVEAAASSDMYSPSIDDFSVVGPQSRDELDDLIAKIDTAFMTQNGSLPEAPSDLAGMESEDYRDSYDETGYASGEDSVVREGNNSVVAADDDVDAADSDDTYTSGEYTDSFDSDESENVWKAFREKASRLTLSMSKSTDSQKKKKQAIPTTTLLRHTIHRNEDVNGNADNDTASLASFVTASDEFSVNFDDVEDVKEDEISASTASSVPVDAIEDTPSEEEPAMQMYTSKIPTTGEIVVAEDSSAADALQKDLDIAASVAEDDDTCVTENKLASLKKPNDFGLGRISKSVFGLRKNQAYKDYKNSKKSGRPIVLAEDRC
jgi:hypothetical protein